VPGRIVVAAGIPRLDSGKVDLAAARTLAISQPCGRSMTT
jgi:hypothetical protein